MKKATAGERIAASFSMRGQLPGMIDSALRRAVKKRTDDIVKICRARQANPNTSLASSGDIGQIVRDIIKL